MPLAASLENSDTIQPDLGLFSFAEYRATCCADEGEENPPKLAERRRVGFGEFRSIPRGLPRGASSVRRVIQPDGR